MSQINIGGIEADAIRIGNVEADAIYIGNELLYPSGDNNNFRYKITVDGNYYTDKNEGEFPLNPTDYKYGYLKPFFSSATSIVFGEKCIDTINIPYEMDNIQSIVINSPQVSHLYLDNTEATSITINNAAITQLPDYFLSSYASEIKEFVMPSGITSIGRYVLDGCYRLEHLTIPSGVTSIGEHSFYDFGTYNMTGTIICYAITPPTLGGDNFYEYVKENGTLYVPSQSVSAYRAANGWNEFINIQAIPNT